MRSMRRAILPLCCLALVLSLPIGAVETADTGWARLKTLVGAWDGTYEGKASSVTYAMVSNGTALMETMEAPDATQMITVYYPDGSSVMMTHFCSMGNQPRMRAKGLKDGRLEFAYVDAANLKGPGDHIMTHLVMSFPDPNHLIQEWTSKESGVEHVGRFEFARRK